MITVDIKSPVFKILSHKNVNSLDMQTRRLCSEGWYPVGAVGRKGNDWVQVMIKEKEVVP